jgi:hypothetical protein
VRWDDLFADLEAQSDALEVAERAGEVAERTRIELAGIGLGDRLRGAVGTRVRLRLLGASTVDAVLTRVGPDWLLLTADGRESVVAVTALVEVAGLGRASIPAPDGAVHARLGLRSALRAIARDRSPVRIDLVSGAAIDATLDRVGADFVEAARHAAGEPRRRGEVREVLLVPFAALAAVSRRVG